MSNSSNFIKTIENTAIVDTGIQTALAPYATISYVSSLIAPYATIAYHIEKLCHEWGS